MNSSNQTPIQLPFDIWDRISNFIPDKELKKLYPVNQALFHISMSVRYCRILTDSVLEHNSIPTWYRIGQNPKLRSQYIKSLVWTNHSSPFHQQFASMVRMKGGPSQDVLRPNSSTPALREAFDSLSQGTRTKKELEATVIRGWEKFLGHLGQLTTLEISWISRPSDPASSSPYLDALFTSGWKTFGHNIRTLSIFGSLEFLEQILSPSLHLERLEGLILNIACSVTPKARRGDMNTVVNFIRKHSETLARIGLHCYAADFPMSITQHIGFLPHLKEFKISHPSKVQGNFARALHGFLLLHRDVLIDVKFGFIRMRRSRDSTPQDGEDWFDKTLYLMTFPNLENLELHLSQTPSVLHPVDTKLIPYLARHSRTLTKLTMIEGPTFTFNLLLNFLDALTQESGTSPLRSLSISVQTLTAAIFGALAIKLPDLQHLRLGHFSIEFDHPSRTDTFQFLRPSTDLLERGLQSLTLGDWSLEVLQIPFEGSRRTAEVTKDVERLLARSIPRVSLINGRSRDECLQEDEDEN